MKCQAKFYTSLFQYNLVSDYVISATKSETSLVIKDFFRFRLNLSGFLTSKGL